MATGASIAFDSQEGTGLPCFESNDVAIEVATVNGSGSQSANKRPWSGPSFRWASRWGRRICFPSNIAGMPTWYSIRASKRGYTARRADADIWVLMNPDSVQEDLAQVKPGAILLIRDDLEVEIGREDVEIIRAPFTKLAAEVCEVAASCARW